MIRVGFFDAKPYDKPWFDRLKGDDIQIHYFEAKLSAETVKVAQGFDAVCVFVNDTIDRNVIDALDQYGVRLIALRCAGYNNVDFRAAHKRINVVRVPGYSPNAVAEHAAALLLTLNRKTHRAFNRTREHNFTLNGLEGFDLNAKTAGVIGTGRIGQAFIAICRGFGMHVIAYDPYPNPNLDVEYVGLDELLSRSDVVSLHCPLTSDTHHIISARSLEKMKPTAYLINTSRGALVDSTALLEALRKGKLGAAGLDVYEEESELFFEDKSGEMVEDQVLSLLLTLPNVLVTSHQGFLTEEALAAIAKVTLENIRAFFDGAPLENEICYCCQQGGPSENCARAVDGRCF
jgi:D-lactate dehydrogenase